MEIMIMWIWSLLFLLELETNNGYTIDYWDCNSIEKTHRYEIENICTDDDLVSPTLTDYSILQIVEKKRFKRIQLPNYQKHIYILLWCF